MLKVLRRKGVSKIILWILAVIIILAFVFFGSVVNDIGSNSSPKPDYAGEIFGKKVPFAEFENQKQQLVISEYLKYGNNYRRVKHLLDQDREIRTWTRILLLREAEKIGINISDEALVKEIQAYPDFQVSGKFDKTLYDNILKNYLRISPTKFEECFRDKIKIDKVTEEAMSSVKVNEDEAKDAFRQYNEKVQANYLFFANDDFKSQIPTDEALVKDFYENRKADFATPPMINVEYLRFDFNDPGPEQNKDPQEPTQEQRDAAWNKAYNIQQELKEKNDFAEIAKVNNLPVNESGFFSMEQPNLKAGWPFELIQQIFAMKPGEISQLVETNQGYQILRIKETKPAAMPKFDEVEAQVTDQWKTVEAAKLAKAKAQEILNKIREGQNTDLMKIAKDLKLELNETPVFGRNENYLPKLGPAPDFIEKAFSLTADLPISDIAETSKGYCIIHLKSRVEADMTEFEKEKEKFMNAILMEKKTKAFNDFLTHLRLNAKLKSYLPEE